MEAIEELHHVLMPPLRNLLARFGLHEVLKLE
jgi:hypothetical protein